MTTSLTRARTVVLAACAAALALLLTAVLILGGRTPAPTAALAADTSTTPVGITVAATGSADGTPDVLVLSMTITVTGATVSTALQQANTTADKVQKALLADGVAKKDLQTSNLSIQTNYDNKGQPRGYAVSESLTAKMRDLTKAGAIISHAASVGGNATRVDGIGLDLSDDSTLMSSARQNAFAEAKKKAEQYAQAAGRSLGAVQSITETVNTNQPLFADAARSAAGGAVAAPVPIQAGSQQVSVTVTVVFAFG